MKIQEQFDQLKSKHEMALIVYHTAGFPTLDASMAHIQLFEQNGADFIEIGIPFSDPIADGPTIQHASHVALQNGVTLKKIITSVAQINIRVPLVMMSYLNPLLAYGSESLFRDMSRAGFSGIIVPDLPVEESEEWVALSKSYGIDLIFLVTPTTSDQRIRLITDRSEGFIYCVSLTGITGVRNGLPPGLFDFTRRVKKATDKPLAVGFGFSTPEQIRMLQYQADGVIVGSRIVDAIDKKEDVTGLIRRLKSATK
ncbi:tryptophan synthase subunit alpha [bacterium]|nr:tryptophan synthase subunit alpha [bacterium]